jgi:2',3'-cyclic-nucleotide 2'-phosphodiesterase / 3'-nucleotidase / 5'-nucleotidase
MEEMQMINGFNRAAFSAAFIVPVGLAFGSAGGFLTSEPAQVSGSTAATSVGWSVTPLITIGEESLSGVDVNLSVFGYRPIGLLDGIGAVPWDVDVLRIFANHEAGAATGSTYQLANGTMLTGGRVSFFDIDTCTRRVLGMGLSYDTIYDRAGVIVTSAAQINEGFASTANSAFDRFCGSNSFLAGEYGLVNDVYFMGEEVGENGSTPATGMGGQQVAIDVHNADAYVVPMLGRGGWESSTMMENYRTDKVVVPWGDDREGIPMWLYIGQKGLTPSSGAYAPPSFLVENGFGFGYTYAWVADNGDTTPQQFNGTGNSRTGKFVKITMYDPTLANTPHWDSLGFASLKSMTDQSVAISAFRFSRPEDLDTNPQDATQFVFCSTGRGTLFPADNWGTIYVFDFEDRAYQAFLKGDLHSIDNVPCTVKILYAGDDSGGGQFAHPDFGIRSPDNCDWADDGFIYINEDKSTSPGSLFGSVSGAEASVWRLDPATGAALRILEIDRTALPNGQFDSAPADKGNWESSGVLDVTKYFTTQEGETLLILDVQGHSMKSNPGVGLAKNAAQGNDLVEGGQLVLASNAPVNPACAADFDCDGDIGGGDLGLLLSAWGKCQGCGADMNGDGTVDGADLGLLLATWGSCQ